MNLFSSFKRAGWLKEAAQWGTWLGVLILLSWILVPSGTASADRPAKTSPQAPSAPALNRPEPDLAAGKLAYETNCARCHGPTGAGDGFDAKRMFPKPRNLAEGIFKFRTTASGTPPTDGDLFHTLSTGLPGSRMPDFQRLPEETRWHLVAYIKSLSPVFQEQTSEPVDLGTDPGPEKAPLVRGKELYAQLGCGACHGALGRANGPSAAALTDNWGNPIRSADLTQGWTYRGGASPSDIVARMMTGIDGTPMPSYAEAFASKEDAWALAYYVHSLQETPHWNRKVEAIKTASLPSGPEDPAWAQAPYTTLRLSNSAYQQGALLPTAVGSISIQAVYNEEVLLLRLIWHDSAENRQTPPDAAGLFFLPDRRQKFQVGSLRAWPAAPEVPALDVCYWSAAQSEAQEAFAREIEGLEDGEEAGLALETAAVYSEGAWALTLQRSLKSPASGGANLAPGKPILFAAAVWDGGNGEKGRHRATSNWVDLVLK